MTDSTQNVPTPAMELGGVPIMCETPPGAAFAQRALHPPGSRPIVYSGIPDGSGGSHVTIPLVGQTNVAPILQVNTGTLVAPVMAITNPSDILLLTTSDARAACHVFMRAAASGWTQQNVTNIPPTTIPQPAAVAMGPYNFLANFASDVSQCRLESKSLTVELNATDFTNQGTITVAKFVPSIVNTSGALTASVKDHLLRISDVRERQSFIDMVVERHLALNPVSARHFIPTGKPFKTADQMQFERDLEINVPEDVDAQVFNYQFQVADFGPTTGGSITNVGNQQVINNVFPNSMSDVLNMSTNSTTRLAREGAFVVHTKTGPTYDWVVPPAGTTAAASQNGLVQSAIRFSTAGTAAYLPLQYTSSTSGSDTQSFSGTPWTNFDWSFILISGLTTPSAPTAQINGLPYLTIKGCEDWSFRPLTLSSQIVHQRRLPVEDRQAIYMVAKLQAERPDSLQASANSLGSIAATVVKYIPSAVSMLKGLFGSKKQSQQQISKIANWTQPAEQRRPRPPRTPGPTRAATVPPAARVARREQAIENDASKIMRLERQIAQLQVAPIRPSRPRQPRTTANSRPRAPKRPRKPLV